MHTKGAVTHCRGSVAQWDNYFEQYKPLYRQLPVMSLPGTSFYTLRFTFPGITLDEKTHFMVHQWHA